MTATALHVGASRGLRLPAAGAVKISIMFHGAGQFMARTQGPIEGEI
jgi:hypothetical protein